jgi:O-antigen ligase
MAISSWWTVAGSPASAVRALRPALALAAAAAGLGELLDWLIVVGVLTLVAGSVLQGLVFMPEAGYGANRYPLLAFEWTAAWIGGAAVLRWVAAGGRALPAAFLAGLAALTATGLVSLATTSEAYATRDAVLFLTSIVVVALAAAMAAGDRRKARALLAGVALVTLLEAVFGLLQYAGGSPTPAYWLSRIFVGTIRIRIHGTLGNPNVFGTFLLMGIGAHALLAMDVRGASRVLPLGALCVLITALALTYSRGAYAGLAAFVLLGAAALGRLRWRAWTVLLVVAAVAAGAAVALPSVGLRAGSFSFDERDTAASRLFIWQTALRMAQAHPWWGTGLGTFNAAYPAYRPPGVLTTYAALRVPGSGHNDYLQWLAETGAVGAGLLGLGAAAALWGVLRRYRRGSDTDRVWLGAWLASTGGVAVASMVNSTISVIPNITLLLVIAATVAGAEAEAAPPLGPLKRALVLPLLGALIGLPTVLPGIALAPALADEASRDVQTGRYLDAVDAFERAAAADPLNGRILPYFGDLLADLYERRLDSPAAPWPLAREQAEALYNRAARLDPWNAYPHAALGRLRAAERSPDAAVPLFREAIALDPYTPRYRLWLAQALAALGDRRQAAEQLEDALRLYALEMLVIERHEGRSPAYARDEAEAAEAHRLLSRVAAMAP